MFNQLLSVLMLSIAQINAEFLSKSLDRREDLNGRVFDNPMFKITSRGIVDCATACAEKACCQTLTFNPITKGCSGYRGHTTTGDAFTADPGTEVYQLIIQPNDYTHVYAADIDMCFSLKADEKNKFEAAEDCEHDGGHLIWMDTADKLAAVEIVLRQYYNNSDISKARTDGEDYEQTNKNYMMSNGKVIPLSSAAWGPGEPNNGNEHCVGFWFQYRLNDFSCYYRIPYICEY